MSEENVEVVRQGADAMNRRDPDAFLACHPDVQWEESGGRVAGAARRLSWSSVAAVWIALH
jgi:ketosteroid isomerase-like protein